MSKHSVGGSTYLITCVTSQPVPQQNLEVLQSSRPILAGDVHDVLQEPHHLAPRKWQSGAGVRPVDHPTIHELQ
jgi:hypothetical protein